MMIDKIYGPNAIQELQGTRRSNNLTKTPQVTDEISVSDEAKALSDAMYLDKVAAETPDVRADLVEKIKLEIQDPNFLSAETISATADKILSAYGF